MNRKTSLIALVCITAAGLAACGGSPSKSTGSASGGGAGGTLIVGMTAATIPGLDTTQTLAAGGEGTRFVGLQLYDGLTKWDLTQGTADPKVIPGLATSWTVSADKLSWTFHLRSGVQFTDGTPWNADAAIFNFDRYVNKSSPLFSTELSAEGGLNLAGVKAATKIDDMTVKIDTHGPWGYLDEDLATLPMASPTAVKAEGMDFTNKPVGTGPFKFESETQGQQLILVRNQSYWAGPAKLDKLILRPIPDATARMAALRSGAVNWIEVPSPDEVPTLKKQGYQVLENSYPHIWPWIFDVTKKPWNDVRVREAANYAINRQSLADNVLQGTGEPANQYLGPADFGFTKTDDAYSYNPTKAKQLLADAGYPNGFTTTLSYPTSGSGNMVPTPMNEALQQDLAAVGIKVQLQPVEWSTMLASFFAGKIPGGADALNISLAFYSPTLMTALFETGSPSNVGGYSDPKLDPLLTALKSEFDVQQRAATYTQINKVLTQGAPWLVVVHDLNPRVLASNVHGFVQPKSWYADLTTVSVS
ncbi:MAG TPA: ABC transporter substrate-binding protein [Candidatus Acidoferrum sp.]|nr:ABC transporter substrate-binding protein [Candidatus Acidoferrum sp.]